MINETGWLTTQYSIASIIKSFSENNIRGSAGVTLVRFDDKYINNQLQQTFKKDLFKELKDQESMKSKVERNIETITNRIIAVAIPEDIGVRLAPRQSNTIDTNLVQDSMNIKVLVNGIKSEDIDETNTTGSKIHQGISFKKNILSDKTPSITLGSQDHENDKTKSLFTSFDITSQNEDVLKKLDLEIIDGDGKTILNAGNLGTIFDQISKAEAKQTESRSVKGSNFETQFSKTSYQLITPNLAINIGQPYPDNSTKYKLTLMVADPESTTKENIPAQNKKVNSRKLLSGEHRWNILNNDELPEQTSLNNFTGNISLDQGNIDQTSADDKSAITIKDIELRSTKSYDSFVDLLGDNWRKQRVRNQLLGTVMANIPGDDHTLRQFHSDVVERYSSIAYEKQLGISPL